MPVPVQSAPGSIGESRRVPEGRWPAEPAGPEVRRTGPSAGTTGTSASASPTGPAWTDTPSDRSDRAQLPDSGRVASDSVRKSRSLVLPGFCRVWVSSMRERSVPPRSGRVRQLRLPPRRHSRKRRDSLADWHDRTCRSGASREGHLSLPLQFLRTGSSGVLFHVEHQVRDRLRRAGLLGRACFTWNTRHEIECVERASSGTPVSRGTPGTRSTASSGPPRAHLFHVEHRVRDRLRRAGLLKRLLRIRRVGALPGLPPAEDTDPMSDRPCGGAGSQTDRRSAYWTEEKGRGGPGPPLANVTRRKSAGVPTRP